MEENIMEENIRYDRGSCEVEVSVTCEADLQQALIMCSKNPGHQQFIPTQQFSQRHLPLGYQDNVLVELVRVLSDLTVRVAVTYTSPDRPDLYPDTNIPYPFSDQKTSTRLRTGSGWVWSVEKFSQMYDNRTCPCQSCGSDDDPHQKWAEVVIGSAAHVVYDDREGQHTTCHLFYDSGRTPDVCSSVLVLRGIAKVDRNVKEDKCRLTYITHDLELADRLELLTTRFMDLQKQLSQRYNSESTHNSEYTNNSESSHNSESTHKSESTPGNSMFSPSRSQARSPSPTLASSFKSSKEDCAIIGSPSNVANNISVSKQSQFRHALINLNTITSFPIDSTSNKLPSMPLFGNSKLKVDTFSKKTLSSAKSVPDIVKSFTSNANTVTPFRHNMRTDSQGTSYSNRPSRSKNKANDSLSSLISFFNSLSGVSFDELNQSSCIEVIDRKHDRLCHRKDQSELTPQALQKSQQSSTCQKSQQSACQKSQQLSACQKSQQSGCQKSLKSACQKSQQSACQKSQQSACLKSQHVTDSQRDDTTCCHNDRFSTSQGRNTSHNEPHKIKFIPSLSAKVCKLHQRVGECTDNNYTQKLSLNHTDQLASNKENTKRYIPTRSRLTSCHRTVVNDRSIDNGANTAYQTPMFPPLAPTPSVTPERLSAARSDHRLTSSSARSLKQLRKEEEIYGQTRQAPEQMLHRKIRSQSVPNLRETDPTLTIIVSHPHGCSKQVSVGHYVQRLLVKDSRNLTKYVYTTPTCPGSSGAPVYVLGRWRGWWPCDHPHNGNSEADRKLNFSGVGLH